MSPDPLLDRGVAKSADQAAVGPRPLSGVVVRFKDAGGHTVDVTVGASGKFSVRLAPGTYSVAGMTSESAGRRAWSTLRQQLRARIGIAVHAAPSRLFCRLPLCASPEPRLVSAFRLI